MKSSGAQAVFIGGLICENGGKLIRDIRANAPKLGDPRAGRLHAGLGGRPAAGGKAEGMYVSVAGLPNDQLRAPARSSSRIHEGGQAALRTRTRCTPRRPPT